jgi:Zn-dependent M28 family amino/carboxypeptidase
VLALAACSSPAATTEDADLDDAPPPPDASVCVPLSTCDWLDGYQRAIVGALSGETEIAPGLRLLHRASVPERDAARQYLLDEFVALGYTAMRHEYATGANVIARLDATEGTGGLVIVGGHFDSVPAGPGAADNATGVAITLAVARYLRDLPTRSHPVIFALFDQEELGLIGSKAYVQDLVAAGDEIVEVHIFDMLSFDGDGDKAVELWSPTAAIQARYEHHGALAGIPIQPVTFRFSDHQAFLDAGFPATGVGEEFVAGDHTPHYHRATDTYANVSFDHLATVTHLALAVLESSVTEP